MLQDELLAMQRRIKTTRAFSTNYIKILATTPFVTKRGAIVRDVSKVDIKVVKNIVKDKVIKLISRRRRRCGALRCGTIMRTCVRSDTGICHRVIVHQCSVTIVVHSNNTISSLSS